MEREFNNRISAQRAILQTINRNHWRKEELFGLSSKTIERWIFSNHIDRNSEIVSLVTIASEKLFFLANKSQDQISEGYQLLRAEIMAYHDMIEREVERMIAG